jgi:hypothetical protein
VAQGTRRSEGVGADLGVNVAEFGERRVNTMLRTMTRSRLIQIWFAAIALIFVAAVAFGAAVTVGTGIMLVTLSLVPLAVALVLWPGVEPRSASEVLHDRNRV